jgi:hypothetical protein
MLYTTDGTPYYLACLTQLGPTWFAEAFPGVTAEEMGMLMTQRANNSERKDASKDDEA